MKIMDYDMIEKDLYLSDGDFVAESIKSFKDKLVFSNNKNSIYLYQANCLELLDKIADKYPEGCFDLIFADPPYNLDKDYKDYNDKEKDNDYIHWCNEWLTLCSRLLTPNGSLFVLNLPKWSIHHAVHLNTMLYFQNWILHRNV